MAVYVYPAVFHPNEDGTFTVTYPDLPGCISEGYGLENSLYMAQSALAQWMAYLTDKNLDIPQASSTKRIETSQEDFVSLIRAEVNDNRAVRRTVSIPKWMDDKAEDAGLSLSRVLQDALEHRFQAST